MKIKVFFATDAEGEELDIVGYARSSENMEMIGYKTTSDEVMTYLKSHDVDLLIISLFKLQFDGFKLIEEVNNSNYIRKPKKIIALTNFISSFVTSRLKGLNVSYILTYPIEMNEFESIVMGMFTVEEGIVKESNDFDLENEISTILHDVGVPAHIRGYYYIRDAITIVYKDMTILNCVTKKLYPMIAEMHQSSATKVERAIRHAIEVAWTRGSAEIISEIFSHTISYQRNRPTNTEFIAMIADKLRISRSLNYKLDYYA